MVLGLVHQLWRPIRGEFDDYIGAPKDSFYQSLHTAVYALEGEKPSPFEVQIRTWDMHYESEYGIAAHWRYKDQRFGRLVERRLDYLRELIAPAHDEQDAHKFVQTVIQDIDSDRIYVYTPAGDVIDLPRGATPIDFAYHIHTEVGHRCRAARVNGGLVPLDYHLKSKDRVEIITANRGGPSLQWLEENLRYVRTNRARSAIKEWFRKQGRDKLIEAGRDALDAQLKTLGIEDTPYESIRHVSHHATVDDMLAAIGEGEVSAVAVAVQHLENSEEKPSVTPKNGHVPALTGVRGYNVRLAQCCSPQPGDEIIGYITQQASVTVHRADCTNLRNVSDRLIPVRWGRQGSVRAVPVEIVAEDRPGLMAEIGGIVASEHVNMSNVRIFSENGMARFNVVMEIDSYTTLSRILSKVTLLENVVEARRRSE
jgi:GTP pyrophosphokinase